MPVSPVATHQSFLNVSVQSLNIGSRRSFSSSTMIIARSQKVACYQKFTSSNQDVMVSVTLLSTQKQTQIQGQVLKDLLIKVAGLMGEEEAVRGNVKTGEVWRRMAEA